MHTISASDCFVVSPSVVFRELSGEAVLLNLESGVYYGLDPVGTRVWSLLNQNHALSMVCSIMVEEFDVEPDVLERDVITLVGDLRDKGLITVNHSARPST